jgi:general secretion pathway protein J
VNRPNPTRARAGSAGFTLIEVIVAVSVLALIGITVAAGLRSAARGSEAGVSLAASLDDLRVIHERLRPVIASAVPRLARVRRTREVAYDGRNDVLTYVTELPPRAVGGGYYRVQLAHDSIADNLVLSFTPLDTTVDFNTRRDTDVDTVTVLEDVTSFEVDYLGTQSSSTSRWSGEWRNAEALPQAVRVTLETARLGKRVLTVRLLAPGRRASSQASSGTLEQRVDTDDDTSQKLPSEAEAAN